METTNAPETVVTLTPKEARERFNNNCMLVIVCFIVMVIGGYRCWETINQEGLAFWLNLLTTSLFFIFTGRSTIICIETFSLAGETKSDS